MVLKAMEVGKHQHVTAMAFGDSAKHVDFA